MADDQPKRTSGDPEPTRTDDVPYRTNGAPRGPDAIPPLLDHLAQLREYAAHYAATRVDQFKARVIRIAFYAVAGIVAGLILLAILVTAAAVLVQGIAQGLAVATGGRMWLGNLLTGLIILLGTALTLWIGWRVWQAVSLRRMKRRYAQRNRRQQSQLGRSVQTAAEQRARR